MDWIFELSTTAWGWILSLLAAGLIGGFIYWKRENFEWGLNWKKGVGWGVVLILLVIFPGRWACNWIKMSDSSYATAHTEWPRGTSITCKIVAAASDGSWSTEKAVLGRVSFRGYGMENAAWKMPHINLIEVTKSVPREQEYLWKVTPPAEAIKTIYSMSGWFPDGAPSDGSLPAKGRPMKFKLSSAFLYPRNIKENSNEKERENDNLPPETLVLPPQWNGFLQVGDEVVVDFDETKLVLVFTK